MSTDATVSPPTGASTDPRSVMARLVEVWAAHDADGFANLFAPDGTMVLPGVYRKGHDEIRAFMAEHFAGRYLGTRVTGEPLDMKQLGPGVLALITTGGVLRPGEDDPSPDEAIRASWILVHGDEGWRLAVYHNCPRDVAGA